MYALLTKREVKMAGYWPSRTRPISSHLDRTSLPGQARSIKDLLYGFPFKSKLQKTKQKQTNNNNSNKNNTKHETYCSSWIELPYSRLGERFVFSAFFELAV